MKAGTELYRNRYSKDPIFEGLTALRNACAPASTENQGKDGYVVDEKSVVNGVRVHLQVTENAPVAQGHDMANVALRWLLHHSQLAEGDGIIIGVSKNQHLTANL